MNEVAVIGGGIVGASVAYRLARSQVRVTLVDRADQGQATAAGAGIISPGTSIKSPDAFFPLAFRAVEYYEELLVQLAEDGETRTGYETVGLLHVATDEDEAARLPGLLRLLDERRAAGVRNLGETSLLNSAEASQLFPPLLQTYGAVHTSGAARVDGRLLRDAMLRAAEKHGARRLNGSASLVMQSGSVVGGTVGDQTLPVDAVIVAGGAWSGKLATSLGLKLPIYPQRGQILHLEVSDGDTSHWPIVVGFHSHYLLTFPPNRVVAGATREDDSGFEYRMTAGGVHEALSEALRVAPGLVSATLREVRIGLRPATPDGLPILGRIQAAPNLLVVTGHGSSGLQLGPYSGALVADLMRGEAAPIDLTPFAPERFEL